MKLSPQEARALAARYPHEFLEAAKRPGVVIECTRFPTLMERLRAFLRGLPQPQPRTEASLAVLPGFGVIWSLSEAGK